jgi:hypothetical protein
MIKNTTLTRRNFLTVTGVGAVALAISMTGCKNNADTTTTSSNSSSDTLLDENGTQLLAEDGNALLTG